MTSLVVYVLHSQPFVQIAPLEKLALITNVPVVSATFHAYFDSLLVHLMFSAVT